MDEKVYTDENFDESVENLCRYWREKGFPNYDSDSYDKKKELDKIIKFDESTIFKDGCFNQTMHGCGFLWTYFPHWIDVKCGKDEKSLIENWNDNEQLKSMMKKTLKFVIKYEYGKLSINRLRQNAKVYCSKQSVSNFRPTVAKYIYNTYGNNGVIWDMSSGWGGRLLGFLSSNCKKYIGTEPSTETFDGLIKLRNDFSYVNKEIELYKMGSEDFVPEKESLDLCFTSPPYFDTEKYSTEETQSYIKYSTKDNWINGYLKKTIENCYYGLKNNSYMIINIANTQEYDFLEKETIRLSTEIGFNHINTYHLKLSSISGKGVKKEPVFMFKKEISDDNWFDRL